jgi:hypothetical protein
MGNPSISHTFTQIACHETYAVLSHEPKQVDSTDMILTDSLIAENRIISIATTPSHNQESLSTTPTPLIIHTPLLNETESVAHTSHFLVKETLQDNSMTPLLQEAHIAETAASNSVLSSTECMTLLTDRLHASVDKVIIKSFVKYDLPFMKEHVLSMLRDMLSIQLDNSRVLVQLQPDVTRRETSVKTHMDAMLAHVKDKNRLLGKLLTKKMLMGYVKESAADVYPIITESYS